MGGEAHLTAGIDPNRPSAARIYDCLLGGTHNFAADRAVAARALELVPELPMIAKVNRAFLRRAVRFAAANGVRQFLDLGSGIPAEGSVHEIARSVHPGARVAYVDLEPTAVLHAQAILGDDPDTVALLGDLQFPDTILTDPRLSELIDFTEPVCFLLMAVLHFVPDGPVLGAALRRYREVAAPGSHLAVSHATSGARREQLDRVADLYNRTGTPVVLRDPLRLAALLDGWDLVEPGIVFAADWRPDPGEEPVGDPACSINLAGVAVKP